MYKKHFTLTAVLFLILFSLNLHAQEDVILGFSSSDGYHNMVDAGTERMFFLEFTTPDCKQYDLSEVGVNVNITSASGFVKFAIYNSDKEFVWETEPVAVTGSVEEYVYQTVPVGTLALNNLTVYYIAIIGTDGVEIKAQSNAVNEGTATGMSTSTIGMYDSDAINYPDFPAVAIDEIHWYRAVSLVVKGNATFYSEAGADTENFCSMSVNLNANYSENGTWTTASGGTFDDISSSTAVFTGNDYGTYTLTWTINDGGCTASDDIQVTLSEDLEDPTMNCIGNTTVTANQYHVYVVNGTEFDPSGITDNCGVASTLNDYNSTSTLANEQLAEGMNLITWTTTDNNGNSVDCSYTITVNQYVGISENANNKISVYPNPTTGIFTIDLLSSVGHSNVKITDVTGKSIENYQLSITNSTVDISNQPSGIYFIKIQTENGVYTEKIIKK